MIYHVCSAAKFSIDDKPHWLLIPQIEHARLSGELAEGITQPLAQTCATGTTLIKATYHIMMTVGEDWDDAPEEHDRMARRRGPPAVLLTRCDRQDFVSDLAANRVDQTLSMTSDPDGGLLRG